MRMRMRPTLFGSFDRHQVIEMEESERCETESETERG